MTSPSPFSAHWPRFVALLGERTGLQVRDKDRAMVQGVLESRRKSLNLSQPERYLELLERDTEGREWKNLLPLLTNGESYFLRDTRQFALLREKIIPELMEAHLKDRQLRFWSAGCSTGEEVYSLAMLADELAPRNKGWNVVVLGTDINETALVRARTGMYNQWSFRGVADEIRERYFRKSGSSWQINERLRSLVEFRALNLRSSDYPNRTHGLADIDLILCRNVLIYLQSDAVAHALRGFTDTLREGGFLLTGHAELAHQTMALKARIFPESVAYQKLSASTTKLEKPLPPDASPVSQPSSAPKPTHPTKTDEVPRAAPGLPRILVTTRTAKVPEAPKRFTQSTEPSVVANLCEVARREANLGRYEPALAALKEAVNLDPVNPDAYAIWAQVASERGDDEEAKRLWKKVVFLAPSRIEAWLDLGSLYAATGDIARAKRMRQTALELLQALPKGAVLHHGTDVNVEELTNHVSELLGIPEKR